jgi:hypothetical protein
MAYVGVTIRIDLTRWSLSLALLARHFPHRSQTLPKPPRRIPAGLRVDGVSSGIGDALDVHPESVFPETVT